MKRHVIGIGWLVLSIIAGFLFSRWMFPAVQRNVLPEGVTLYTASATDTFDAFMGFGAGVIVCFAFLVGFGFYYRRVPILVRLSILALPMLGGSWLTIAYLSARMDRAAARAYESGVSLYHSIDQIPFYLIPLGALGASIVGLVAVHFLTMRLQKESIDANPIPERRS